MNQWDRYFFDLCQVAASNSKCRSRRVGAILVHGKKVFSTGYNGPPAGIAPCESRYALDENLRSAIVELGDHRCKAESIDLAIATKRCPRQYLGFKSGKGLEWCIAGHGERNAIINAASLGVPTKGATLYMNCAIPCKECMIEIINAEIAEMVVVSHVNYDLMSAFLVEQSNIKIRIYDLPDSILHGERVLWEGRKE